MDSVATLFVMGDGHSLLHCECIACLRALRLCSTLAYGRQWYLDFDASGQRTAALWTCPGF